MTADGLLMHKAMYELALPHRDTRAYAVATWRDGWGTPRSFDHDSLLQDIAQQIRSGTLQLRGRRAGEPNFAVIANDFLNGAVINLGTNELKSGDIIFYGVRVFAVAENEIYKSGVGGRPTSKGLWTEKFRQRVAASELSESLKGEAEWLASWLERDHPNAPRGTWKTIQEDIRGDYRRAAKPTLKPT